MLRLRRPATLFAILVCVGLFSGAGQAPPPRRITFNTEQQAALDRLSGYLNSIHTFKSSFTQLGPEGQLDQGQFLMQKPGKLRFSFDPPNPTLIVATGGKIYVKNSRLNTLDAYDVSDLPLDLLLDDKVNLKANPAITGIDIENDALVLHARTTTNRQQGNITFVFSNPAIELRQWSVKDNQGGTTMVVLHNAVVGVDIDETLFTAPVKDPKPKK
jgi:outer membrane lipoprotein-sorting protein